MNRLRQLWAGIQPEEKRYLLILLVLGLAIRVIYVFTVDLIPPDASYADMDAVEFDHLGWSLAQGHGFTNRYGDPTADRFPGFPFFLAFIYFIFGHKHIAVLLAQAVLGTLPPLLLYLTAKELVSLKASRIAGLICAVYPIFIWYTGWIMSETLFFALLSLLIYLTISLKKHLTWGRLAWVGVVIGILSLVRGVGLPFMGLIPLYVYIIYKGKFGQKLARAALVGVVAAAMLVPWTIRNRLAFDRWMLPSSEAGAVMWMALNRVDLTKYFILQPAFDYVNRVGRGNATSEEFYQILNDTNYFGLGGLQRLFELYYPDEPKPVTEPEALDRLSAKCSAILRANPGVWVAKSFTMVFRFWHVLDERGRYLFGYGFIIPFFLAGAWMTRKRLGELLPLYLFLLVMYGLAVPFEAAGRYRAPFEGVLIIVGAVAIERFLSRFRRVYWAYGTLAAFFLLNYYLKLHSLQVRLAIRSVAGALGFKMIEM